MIKVRGRLELTAAWDAANTGLVISLNSDCIALVPLALWPKSRAVSQIFSQLVEVAILAAKLELTWVLQSL